MGWYFTITEEMRALGLKGNELLVFAILHGYSQKGDGCYYGGQALLAERAGVALRTLRDVLYSLKDKGLLEEFPVVRHGRSIPAYTVICPAAKSAGQAAGNADGDRQNLPVATGKICRKKDNIIIPTTNVDRGVYDNTHARVFAAPTIEQVRAYCAERRIYIDPVEFVEHYTSNGWMVGRVKMKDWRATVRTWERRRKQGTSPAAPSNKKGDFVINGMKTLDSLQGTHYFEEYMAAKNRKQNPVIDEQ